MMLKTESARMGFVYVLSGLLLAAVFGGAAQAGWLDEPGAPSGVLWPVISMLIMWFIGVPLFFAAVAGALSWAMKGEK